jgi:hypothetical protein
MENLQTIDLTDLALICGGQDGPPPNPQPANRGINEPTYRYYGGEAGRATGEVLGSPTLSKHLQEAGQAVGTGLFRAGEWIGNQVNNVIRPK